MRNKLLVLLEIILTYATLRLLGTGLRSTGVVQRELEILGWSYTGEILFIAIPALVIWLARRNWVDYGISLTDWQTNLDIGIKAYLVRIISVGALVAALLLGIGYISLKSPFRSNSPRAFPSSKSGKDRVNATTATPAKNSVPWTSASVAIFSTISACFRPNAVSARPVSPSAHRMR